MEDAGEGAGSGRPKGGLTGVVVGGLKWSYASTFINAGLQIAVTAVLARLLTPAEFGLVAMAMVLLRFGQYFAQMGVGQAVVQRQELTTRDVHTAFTSSVVLGIAFTALFVLLAPIARWLYPGAADVVLVTRVMALTFTFGGITAATQALLRRRFAFRAIAITEVASYVLGYALVGLVLALNGAGVWSLVAASLGQAGLSAATYAVLCRRDLGVALDRDSFVRLYSFGGRVSVIGFLEFAAGNLDVLWAGHFLGTSVTGLYTRATNLANVPLQYFTTSLSRVLLPAYARIQEDVGRLRSTYLLTMTVVAAVGMPVAWGVAGASDAVIRTLLGGQWLDAVPVLSILSLAVPLALLTHFGAILCEATATLNVKIVIVSASIGCLALLLLLLGGYGVIGVAVAFALSVLFSHVAYLVTMKRLLVLRWRELAATYWQGAATGAVVGVALYALDSGLRSLGMVAPLRLLAALALGAGLLTLSLLKLRGGRVWHELRSRLRARP